MSYYAIIVLEPRYSAHNFFQSRLRRHMTLLRKTCAQLCAAIRPNSILMSQALLSIGLWGERSVVVSASSLTEDKTIRNTCLLKFLNNIMTQKKGHHRSSKPCYYVTTKADKDINR